MSKSLDIPDWRRGAIYWRPLLDGREVTIYPLTFGAARLCVGPLADQDGYDAAYRYDSHALAIQAADDWNPEDHPTPTGFTVLETKKDADDDLPEIGAHVKVLAEDAFNIMRMEHGPDRIDVTRRGRRGVVLFSGLYKQDVDGVHFAEVTDVSFHPYGVGKTNRAKTGEEDPVAQWPHPENNRVDPF